MNSKRIFIILLNIHAISSMDIDKSRSQTPITMDVDTFNFEKLKKALSVSAPVTPQKKQAEFNHISKENTPENTPPRPSCNLKQVVTGIKRIKDEDGSERDIGSVFPDQLTKSISSRKGSCKKNLFPSSRDKRKSADSSDDEE